MSGMRKNFSDGGIVCSKCGEWHEISNYRHQRTICLKCRHQENNDLVNKSVETYINRMVIVARSRAKKAEIEFTITKDNMVQQFFDQGNRCFYTGLEMQWGYGKGKSPYSMSLDKIESAMH